MSKVAIIIPMYNGKDYIGKTIDSCVNQDFKDIEVLIIDDFSVDDSYEYVKKYIKKYSEFNISIRKNDTNSGVLATCNEGATLTDSEWILFLGQDDVLPKNYLLELLKHVDENISFAFCNPMMIDKNDHEIRRCRDNTSLYENKKSLCARLAQECVIASTGLIINRSKFLAVGGFDTKYKNYGEWNLWIRLLCVGDFYFFENGYSYYRRHDTNMTNSFRNKNKVKTLHKYWNECRKKAIHEFKLEFIDFQKAFFHYIIENLKYGLRIK